LGGAYPLGEALTGLDVATPDSGARPLSIAVIGEETSRVLRFAGHRRISPETCTHAVLLQAGDCHVGRTMLLSFADPRHERRMIGLMNLNFYVADIHSAYRDLSAKGYELWWPPKQHTLSASAGQKTGALLEEPYVVTVNLIQLESTDPSTRIGRMRKFFLGRG
jgi:hypothetical protein